MAARDVATTAKARSRANAAIRKIRLDAARSKGRHTEQQWLALVALFDCKCVMCGQAMQLHEVRKDHIKPIYQGGSDGIENLQPLCEPCNSTKGPDSTNWASYRLERGFE